MFSLACSHSIQFYNKSRLFDSPFFFRGYKKKLCSVFELTKSQRNLKNLRLLSVQWAIFTTQSSQCSSATNCSDQTCLECLTWSLGGATDFGHILPRPWALQYLIQWTPCRRKGPSNVFWSYRVVAYLYLVMFCNIPVFGYVIQACSSIIGRQGSYISRSNVSISLYVLKFNTVFFGFQLREQLISNNLWDPSLTVPDSTLLASCKAYLRDHSWLSLTLHY